MKDPKTEESKGKDGQAMEREERALALAEKWDRVIEMVDPEGHELQDPPRDEFVPMIRDFLLDADEPLALEVLSLQEFVIVEGCEDPYPVVDLLNDIRDFLGDDPLVEELFDSELPDSMEETAGRQEDGLYRYYSTHRPVDIGTYPRPAGNIPVTIENFDSRILVDNGNMLAWGYLEYEKPLTKEQYSDYELKPAFTATDYRNRKDEEELEERSVLADLRSEKTEKEKNDKYLRKTVKSREETR